MRSVILILSAFWFAVLIHGWERPGFQAWDDASEDMQRAYSTGVVLYLGAIVLSAGVFIVALPKGRR